MAYLECSMKIVTFFTHNQRSLIRSRRKFTQLMRLVHGFHDGNMRQLSGLADGLFRMSRTTAASHLNDWTNSTLRTLVCLNPCVSLTSIYSDLLASTYITRIRYGGGYWSFCGWRFYYQLSFRMVFYVWRYLQVLYINSKSNKIKFKFTSDQCVGTEFVHHSEHTWHETTRASYVCSTPSTPCCSYTVFLLSSLMSGVF